MGSRIGLDTLAELGAEVLTLMGVVVYLMSLKRNRRGVMLVRPAPLVLIVAAAAAGAAPYFVPAVNEVKHVVRAALQLLNNPKVKEARSQSFAANISVAGYLIATDARVRTAVPRVLLGTLFLGVAGQAMLTRGTLRARPGMLGGLVVAATTAAALAFSMKDVLPLDARQEDFSEVALLRFSEHLDLVLRVLALLFMLIDSGRQHMGESGWAMGQALAQLLRIGLLFREQRSELIEYFDLSQGSLPPFPNGTAVLLGAAIAVLGVVSILKANGLLHVSSIFTVGLVAGAVAARDLPIPDEFLKRATALAGPGIAFLACGTIFVGGAPGFAAVFLIGNVLTNIHKLEGVFMQEADGGGASGFAAPMPGARG